MRVDVRLGQGHRLVWWLLAAAGLAAASALLAPGVWLGLTLGPQPAPPAPGPALLSFAWPEYPYSLSVDAETLQRLEAALARAGPAPGPADPRRFYWVLDLAQGPEGRRLFLTRQGIGFDPATGRLLDAGEVLAVLAPARARLEDQVFGELLPWPEVEPLFPIGTTAELRDVESRLSLRVHRHRGDAHFDVEPLTAADSRTLYEIYGGRWSWKRRAAVLSAGGRRIAASMNGMPHGWGDIADNDFPGHFCVHVSGSRVHTTWRVDTGHQLMVLKAAGRLAETLETAEPRQLVDLVLAALNQAETATLRFTLDEGGLTGGAPDGLLADLLAEIRHLTVTGLEVARAGETEATVRASVTVYFHQPDPDAAFPHTLHVRLTRPSAAAAWSVELASLAPLLDRNRPGRSAALPAVPGTVQPPPPSEGAKPGEEEWQCLPDGVLGRCVRGRRRGIGGRPPCWRSCCWQGGADRR